MIAIASCFVQTQAYGQTSPYAGALAILALEPGGTADGHYLSGDVEGVAPGFSGFGGVKLGRVLIVQGEVALAAPLKAERQRRLVGGGIERATTAHRDFMISGLAGYQTSTERVIGQFVGGFSVSRGTTTRRDIVFEVHTGTSPPMRLPDETVTEHSLGVSAGVNVLWRISMRAHIVSAFRVHHFGDRDTKVGPLSRFGIGSNVFHLGIGVRADF